MNFLPYVSAAWICVIGLYGAIREQQPDPPRALPDRHPVVDVRAAARDRLQERAASRFSRASSSATTTVDPVVQALALTDIVVSVTVVALILALALDAHAKAGTVDPDELAEFRG